MDICETSSLNLCRYDMGTGVHPSAPPGASAARNCGHVGKQFPLPACAGPRNESERGLRGGDIYTTHFRNQVNRDIRRFRGVAHARRCHGHPRQWTSHDPRRQGAFHKRTSSHTRPHPGRRPFSLRHRREGSHARPACRIPGHRGTTNPGRSCFAREVFAGSVCPNARSSAAYGRRNYGLPASRQRFAQGAEVFRGKRGMGVLAVQFWKGADHRGCLETSLAGLRRVQPLWLIPRLHGPLRRRTASAPQPSFRHVHDNGNCAVTSPLGALGSTPGLSRALYAPRYPTRLVGREFSWTSVRLRA